MTAASIIRRSASGSAIFPKRDSTCQRRARNPSIWSVTPATPKRIPAGQLCVSPACTIRTTKTGMSASRPSVRAFGSCASGAGIARVAIRHKSTGALLQRPEAGGPVRRAGQVGHLRGRAAEAPGAVVGEIARMGRGRLDLRALAPFVEARDRDAVRVGCDGGPPEVVVRGAVAAAPPQGALAGAYAVVARADARHAEQPTRVRLLAQADELPASVVDEVVRVEAVEPAGGCEAHELRPREEPHRDRLLRGH